MNFHRPPQDAVFTDILKVSISRKPGTIIVIQTGHGHALPTNINVPYRLALL
jgi:hypothetical protein